MTPADSLARSSGDALRAAIRTIPDFPAPGILFRDVTPLLAVPALLGEAVERLAEPYREAGITHVLGIEARGFWLGPLVAQALGAGFVPVRKKGKLPGPVYAEAYALEYGIDEVQMHRGALPPTARVLVHDDVIATGGTARAAARLAEQSGAEVAGFSFLVELTFLDGRATLDASVPFHRVLDF